MNQSTSRPYISEGSYSYKKFFNSNNYVKTWDNSIYNIDNIVGRHRR